MPPLRSAKRQLVELATTEWEEEAQPSPTTQRTTQKEPPAKDTETQPSTTTAEQEPVGDSPRPKRRRLDRKDGRRLVKDTAFTTETTAPAEPTTTLEIFREPQPIITAQSQRGKGVLRRKGKS